MRFWGAMRNKNGTHNVFKLHDQSDWETARREAIDDSNSENARVVLLSVKGYEDREIRTEDTAKVA